MRKHVLISLIIVTMKVRTVTVTSPQLVHITVVISYWFTDPTISTHIFPHTLSRNRFESIWQVCRYSENSQQTQDSEWLFKIWPVYEYFVQKFRSVYSPKQELSLHEAMIPLRGRLNCTTYNPGKIEYGVLVRMVCEVVSGYICNMEIY
jgi:hypothetical protein